MAILTVGHFEEVASGNYLEGLAVDYERGIVWYSDVIGGGVHSLKPDGSSVSLKAGRMWTGGVLVAGSLQTWVIGANGMRFPD